MKRFLKRWFGKLKNFCKEYNDSKNDKDDLTVEVNVVSKGCSCGLEECSTNSFKVGDFVRIKGLSAIHTITGVMTRDIGILILKGYILDKNESTFYFPNELELVVFKKGDIVKLNANEIETINAINRKISNPVKFDKEYLVTSQRDGFVKLEGFGSRCFKQSLFILVNRPEKVKEVTIEELEDLFDCKIKIVKGEHNE